MVSGCLWRVLHPGRGDGWAGDVNEDLRAGRARGVARMHPGLPWQPVPLTPVAGRAGGDDVLPARGAALRARDDVIDRQVGARAAVLAGPAVAREHGPPGDLSPVRVAG